MVGFSGRSKRGSICRRTRRHKFRCLDMQTLESRRLLAIDWRNPVNSNDVNRDHHVSPTDALAVINQLAINGNRPLTDPYDFKSPYYDVDGNQAINPLDALRVINAIARGSTPPYHLSETNFLTVEDSVTISVGQASGSRHYRLQIEADFDNSDTASASHDAIAIYLLDTNESSTTLLDRGTTGTSLFTLSESGAEYAQNIVRFDGNIADIDLGSIENVDTASLRFQLINNDSDVGSTVTITPLTNDVDTAVTAASLFTGSVSARPPGPAIDVSTLFHVSDVAINVENVRYSRSTREYVAEMRLENFGTNLSRNVVAVFDNLPNGVRVMNASGTTSGGAPYVNFRPAIPSGGLASGLRSMSLEIRVEAPSSQPFALSPTIFASSNQFPLFDPIPTLSVTPGDALTHELNVVDPDGDIIRYSLVADGRLPPGSLDANGILRFTPSPSDIGSYAFSIVASDGKLSTFRDVTLDVIPDPIISTRVSGAILTTTRDPLVGVTVELGGVSTSTAADGTFTLDFGNMPPVSDTLKVRGELLSGPETFPFIAEKLDLILEQPLMAGVNNRIARPIYLPALDTANAKLVDPLQETVVTTDAIPGMALTVQAGTLMSQLGTPFFGSLSITEVPPELTPAALPEGMFPDLVVTIQPGEMVFTTPAPLTFPNRAGWAPGVVMDLMSINPVTGEFDDVGDMVVSTDGETIETVSGGVRNSSWHFPSPPPPPKPPEDNNDDDDCDECEKGGAGSSTILFHTGALLESHALTTYQSLGESRGLTFVYDSMRADPRPIIHTAVEDIDPAALGGEIADQLRLVAELRVQRGTFSTTVPGYAGNDFGLDGGENFWSLPDDPGSVDAALQVDLRAQPSGLYDYIMSSGIRLYSPVQDRFVGSAARQTGHVLNVNLIDSPFGSGWGIAGLQQLIENPDGSLMLIDGDGSELLYRPNPASAATRDYLLPDLTTNSIFRYDGKTGSFKDVFVTSGSGGLVSPHDPTFGPDGNLYVFSNSNNFSGTPQILRYDGTSGDFIDVFVDTGSNGFTNGIQMAFGPDGNLYVSNSNTGSEAGVLKFDGTTGASLGTVATGNGIQRACGIAFGPDGNLYVGDSDASSTSNYDRVLRYDPFTGNLIDVFVPSGDLNNTCQIDFGSDGNLYVAENTTQDIRVFDGQTGVLRKSIQVDSLQSPYLTTSGPDGNLYIGSQNTIGGQVLRVDAISGEVLNTFVGNNSGFGTFFPGENPYPQRRVQDLLIQDIAGDTVLRYDGLSGNLIGPFVARGAGGLDEPHNPTIGPDGNLYVFSGTTNDRKILRFDGLTGDFIDTFVDNGEGGFTGGAKIEFGPDGSLYTGSGSQVLRYDSNGNLASVAASEGLQAACGIQFGDDGYLYVYDTADEEMRRYNPDTGDLLDVFIPSSGNLINACDFDIGIEGDIYITDLTLGGVRRFSGQDGTFLGVFTHPSRPASGVVFGPDGDLYVNDSGNLARYDGTTGEFVETFVSGNSGFVNFLPPPAPIGATGYSSPTGDFSSFEKLDDGTYRRTMTDQTIYEFDRAGRLVRMSDRNHNTTEWEYDPDGNLYRWIDPVGLVTTLNYSAGKLASVTDPAGRVTAFEHDSSGNLMTITDPDGSSRVFDYDADHRMTGETDKRGNHEQARYDFAGRVDFAVRKDGSIIDISPTQVRGLNPSDQTSDPFGAPLAYGTLDGKSTYVDANGNLITSDLDGLGQETGSTDQIGAMPTYDYDPTNNLISKITDARGHDTSYTYDSRGNLTSVADEISPLNPLILAYDPKFNQLSSLTDELGHTTLFDIDSTNGNILSMTQVIGSAGGGDDLVTHFTYTLQGLTASITDPLGRESRNRYDTAGRLVNIQYAVGTADEADIQFEYDAAGNLTAIVDENGNRSQYEYDAMNRLQRIVQADPDGTGPLASPVTRLTYDQAGNLVGMTDARGNETTYVYDVLNRRTIVEDALDHQVKANYDKADNPTSLIDELSHRTGIVFDARNRVVESVAPDGGRTHYQYDLDDNLTAITDAVGNTTHYQYDARNRVVQETDPLGRTTVYEYDVTDRLIAITDRLGRKTEYTYDDADRLLSETWVGDGNQFTFTYDAASNLVSASDEFSTLGFQYDSRDRLISVDNAGTPDVPHVVLQYSYDAVGNVQSMADSIAGSAGGVNTYQYDGLNRMTRITQSGTNVTEKRVDFTYNLLGQFESISRHSGQTGQLVANSAFVYDALNRLTTLDHASATTIIAFTHLSYDSASRITKLQNVDGTTDYAYDNRDELVSAIHSDASNPDEDYRYDANGNRIFSHLHDDGYVTGINNRLLSDGSYNYSYDAEGNLSLRTEIASGATRAFQWDYRNRLVAVIDKDSAGTHAQRVEFTYDALDRRISKNVVTATDTTLTHFVYDGINVLLDFIDSDGSAGANPATLAQRYLHGPAVDQVLAQDDGTGSTSWMLTDHLGSVTDLVSDQGVVVEHRRYDSFGRQIAESEASTPVRYGFTGREFDSEIDLLYLRNRFMDAESGRFISEDPIAFSSMDSNLYRYVNNSPVNFRDPFGREASQWLYDLNPNYKHYVNSVNKHGDALDYIKWAENKIAQNNRKIKKLKEKLKKIDDAHECRPLTPNEWKRKGELERDIRFYEQENRDLNIGVITTRLILGQLKFEINQSAASVSGTKNVSDWAEQQTFLPMRFINWMAAGK